jgi:hypothetical protein
MAAEQAARIAALETLIKYGHSESDATRMLAREYNLTDKEANTYLARWLIQVADGGTEHAEWLRKRKALVRIRSEGVFQEARNTGNLNAANKALEIQIKLDGLAEASQIDMQVTQKTELAMMGYGSIEEQREHVARWLAEQAAIDTTAEEQ